MSLIGGVLGVILAKYVFIPGMVKGMQTTPMAPFLINFSVTWAVLASAFADLRRRGRPRGLRPGDPLLAGPDRGRSEAGVGTEKMAIPL